MSDSMVRKCRAYAVEFLLGTSFIAKVCEQYSLKAPYLFLTLVADGPYYHINAAVI